MTTDLAQPVTTDLRRQHQRALPTLALGLFGGLTLGIAARAWMRLIAEDPAFTWNGTIFIVLGFTIFGFTQSIVAIAFRRNWTRAKLTVARVIGTVGMLPLFVAAGGVMLPTVVGGGFASARREWRSLTRWIWALVALVPVLLVGNGLTNSFGWSLHAVAGFLGMLALYATIVGVARFTFRTRPDGKRLPQWVRISALVVVGLLLLFFTVGFIFR